MKIQSTPIRLNRVLDVPTLPGMDLVPQRKSLSTNIRYPYTTNYLRVTQPEKNVSRGISQRFLSSKIQNIPSFPTKENIMIVYFS